MGHYGIDNTMTHIQFGFCMPADKLDKQRRATFSDDLNRALELITGHFDSAWIIDHLQFGDDDMLEAGEEYKELVEVDFSLIAY